MALFAPLIVSIAALFLALFELRAHLASEQLPEVREVLNLELSEYERNEYLSQFKKASEHTLAPLSALSGSAALLRGQSRRVNDLTKSIDLLCQAFETTQTLVEKAPFEAKYLTYWAELRQALGSYDCRSRSISTKDRSTSPSALDPTIVQADIIKTLNFAVANHPSSAQVNYSAALVSHWAGDRENALKLFGAVVRLQNPLPENWRRFIVDQIKQPADFEKIVPASFPQVEVFTRAVLDQHPNNIDLFANAIANTQESALKATLRDFESGLLSSEQYLIRLLSLDNLIAQPKLRSRVDLELARIYKRNSHALSDHLSYVKYFEQRAKTSELKVLRGYLDSDSRSANGALANWNSTRYLAFDTFFQSVGFFMPPGQHAVIAEINSTERDAKFDLDTVELLVSDDNQKWQAFDQSSEKIEKYIFSFPNKTTIALVFPALSRRYYKLHFTESNRPNQIHNDLRQLIVLRGIIE